MTPESIAKELGLEYIGKNTLLEDCPECDGWKMVDGFYTESGSPEYCDNCTDGKVDKIVGKYIFNPKESD